MNDLEPLGPFCSIYHVYVDCTIKYTVGEWLKVILFFFQNMTAFKKTQLGKAGETVEVLVTHLELPDLVSLLCLSSSWLNIGSKVPIVTIF